MDPAVRGFLIGGIGVSLRGCLFRRFFLRGFFFRRFFLRRFLFPGLSRHRDVDGLQGRFGSDRRAAQRFNAVLAEGERPGLADELARKRFFRRPLAQARGFVRCVNGQALNGIVILQHRVHCHFSAEALGAGGKRHRILPGRFRGFLFRWFFLCGFFLCRLLFRRFLFRRFLFRRLFLCRLLFRRLSRQRAVERLQGRVGRDRCTAQGFNAVFAESKGTCLADKLAGKLFLRRPLPESRGFVRRINAQGFDGLVPVQHRVHRHLAAEALFAGRNLRGSVPDPVRHVFSARQSGQKQGRSDQGNQAQPDSGPLLFLKLVHAFLPFPLRPGS